VPEQHEGRREHDQWRHLALLISILVLFIICPFIAPLRHGVTILSIVAAAVLVSATYAVSTRKHFLSIALVLSVAVVLSNFMLAVSPSYWILLVSQSTVVVLTGFFAVTILRYVVRSGKITSDKIYAAICVYFLFGYAWTFAYALLDELQPGAFAAPTPIGPDNYVARVMQMRYFSFVTLTTVGYGDVVPRQMLEAIMGQFYLVALVGRLVGLHIVHGNVERSR
jgi:voltage-gated potassium channel